jgi:hypothetical protein
MKRFGIRGMTAGALFLCLAMAVSTTQAFAWAVNACPLTQGFWKNHPQDWEGLPLTIGGISYSQTELLDIFDLPVGGNAVLNLAHQLIAAELNINLGSINTVGPTITDANNLLAKDCPSGIIRIFPTGTAVCGVSTSSTDGQSMVNDAAVLDAFNSGFLNPSCTPATFAS